jgi:chemotaxis response regulator CheB
MANRPVVLIVDDDASMRELLETMISLDGSFRIGGVAADGFEGAMLAADVHPDVVILDFFMPRWDGEKAADFIRKNCPACTIVGFSAVLTEQPAWADHFLVKNDIEGLMGLVHELTDGQRASGGGPAVT